VNSGFAPTAPTAASSSPTYRARNPLLLILAISGATDPRRSRVPDVECEAGISAPDASTTTASGTQFLPTPAQSEQPPRTITVPAKPSTTTVLVPPPMPTVESQAAISTAVGVIQGVAQVEAGG